MTVPIEGHTVMVVDDDDDMRALIAHMLEGAGHRVVQASNGAEALRLARERRPALVTLDRNMPDMEGTEVCQRLREFSDAFVIMVSAQADEDDRLSGLDVGADDYLAKPFSARELQARVAAFLRRARPVAAPDARDDAPGAAGPAGESLDLGQGLRVDAGVGLATLDGEPLALSTTEVRLLAALGEVPRRPWSRRELAQVLWSQEAGDAQLLLDVQVGNLRRTLRRASGGREWVRSVGGVSYGLLDAASGSDAP